MTLSQQSAILVQAVEYGLLQPDDIIRWADSVIATMETPPAWLINLETMQSPHFVDLVSHLRKNAEWPLPVVTKVQLLVLAYEANRVSFNKSLSWLFQVTIVERNGAQLDELGERLRDALIELDMGEDFEVVQPPLRTKFEVIFQEYLRDANEIAAIIPWRLQRTGDSRVAPDSPGFPTDERT
jgi:hypothetical protein